MVFVEKELETYTLAVSKVTADAAKKYPGDQYKVDLTISGFTQKILAPYIILFQL